VARLGLFHSATGIAIFRGNAWPTEDLGDASRRLRQQSGLARNPPDGVNLGERPPDESKVEFYFYRSLVPPVHWLMS